MRRMFLCILPLLLASFCYQDDARAKAAEGLKLTLTPDKTAVSLGETISVEVRLDNGGDKDAEVSELVLEERSVNFDILFDEGAGKKECTFTVTRPDMIAATRMGPSRFMLKPGKSLITTMLIPAVRPGLMKITARYTGAARTVLSSQIKVDVRLVGQQSKLVAVVETSKGEVSIELYPDEAPNTVMNFVSLVNRGFYDGLLVHRIVKDFLMQTGCPYGLGIGGPGYSVKSEAVTQNRKHEQGTVSMARYENSDASGSQFFVCLKNLPTLDKQYTIIGKVTDVKVLDAFNNEETDHATERPKKDITVKKITLRVQ